MTVNGPAVEVAEDERGYENRKLVEYVEKETGSCAARVLICHEKCYETRVSAWK